ncbi:hypothetical protein [Tolypothrix sp. NIES-4075]|nr:hypothetical protein [Tolypothrix sp. NIES-4075]
MTQGALPLAIALQYVFNFYHQFLSGWQCISGDWYCQSTDTSDVYYPHH